MPKISVLVPIYNTKEEYLREMIESVLNQTFKDFEFIMINDGSTNNAEEVILSYKDDRIKYSKQENQGIAITRNRLINMAQGEYLALIDHDDVMLPERFEKQIEILDSNPDIGIVASNIQFFGNKNEVTNFVEKPKFIDILKRCEVAQPSAMLRKSVFDKYNLRYKTGYTYAEDYELWLRASLCTEIYNIKEPLTKYRWHGKNMSAINKYIQDANAIKVQKEFLDYLVSNKKDKKRLENALLNFKPNNLTQKIFSVNNSYDKSKKIITLFGNSFEIKNKMGFKRYDLIFSIGEACASSSAIRKHSLQDFSYPFDWLYGSTLKGRLEILANEFKDFINKEDLGFAFENRSIKCMAYTNKKNNITFNHDFLKDIEFDEAYELVRKKYDRRIKRLLEKIEKSKSILMIYLEAPYTNHVIIDDAYIIESFKIIKNKYPDKKLNLLYISNKIDEKLTVRKLSNDITRCTLDYKMKNGGEDYDVSYSPLKQIYGKIMLSNVIRHFYMKIRNFLIKIIPSRSLRISLRNKLHIE